MRKLFTTYAANCARVLALAVVTCFGIQATNATDLGEIELGKTYEIEKYQPLTGHFTASEGGKVLIEGENIGIFSDADYTNEIATTCTGYASLGITYTFDAESGTTYYLYTKFPMASKIRISMKQELDFVNVEPAAGSSFSVSGTGTVNIQFNLPVTVGKASITANGTTARVGVSSSGSYISVDLATALTRWLENSTIKKGDEFTLTINDIKSTADESLYNGDGIYTVKYIAAGQPAQLLKYDFPKIFKSYFAPGDPDGIATLTFDRDLQTEGAEARISYGDIEAADGQFYMERLPVAINGAVATVDLTGKSRRVAEMIGSAAPQELINIQITGLRDTEGNFVQTTATGAAGSFSFNCNYLELPRIDVMADFFPAHGSSLADVDKLEIWISGLNGIRFNGFKFEYADGSETKSAVVNKNDCEFTPEEENSGTYIVAIPAEVKGKQDITVTLHELVSTDGIDHSNDVRAKYDAFVITYSSPDYGAELARLNNGDEILIETNYLEKYPEMFITYQIFDLDAAEGENSLIKPAAPLALNDDNYHKAIVEGSYRLVRGHRYNMEFTAWENEAAKNNGAAEIGKATILLLGTSEPFQTSETRFVSITPSVSTVLKPTDNVFTLKFDGMVNIMAADAKILSGDAAPISFATLEPEEAVVDENSGEKYSNTWVLTADKDYMQNIGPKMQISIRATDMNGNLVVDENETNPEESFVFIFNYDTTQSGLDSVIAPENGSYIVYNLQGIHVATVGSPAELENLPAGLYIVNGVKTVIK